MLIAETSNPILPSGSLLAWNALIVVSAAVFLIALISIYRNRASRTLLQAALWIAALVIAPLLGSLVWLGFGRRLHGETTPRRVEHNSIR